MRRVTPSRGTVTVDPGKPTGATGRVRVDMNAVHSGVEKRDSDMRGRNFLDTEAGEVNRYVTFEIVSVEMAGPLEPNKETPAKVNGILSIKGKAVETAADARVTYVKLAPEQAEAQKRFGFTADNIKVRAPFRHHIHKSRHAGPADPVLEGGQQN